MDTTCNFNWFNLDRNILFDMLYSVESRIVNKKLTVKELNRILTAQVRKFLPVKTKRIEDAKIERGWVYVGGSYYSDKDEDGLKSIQIEFAFRPNEKTITLSDHRFARLCLSFADTMLHEIIHMRQHRRRNFKVLPDFPSTANRQKQREEQSYLGCRDEIDAYAFNIACELNDKFNGSQRKAMQYLNLNQKGLSRRPNSYLMYLRAFGHNHNHPIIKQVKKKVASYFPQAKFGKPYKNSEWINH